MCEYKQKHTPTETRSRGQKLARIEVLALSMCWRVTLKSAKSNTKLYPNYQYVEGWYNCIVPAAVSAIQPKWALGGPFATETPKINGGAHYRKNFRIFFGDRFNTALGSFRKIPAFSSLSLWNLFLLGQQKKKDFSFSNFFFFPSNQQPTMSFPLASREPHESKNILSCYCSMQVITYNIKFNVKLMPNNINEQTCYH